MIWKKNSMHLTKPLGFYFDNRCRPMGYLYTPGWWEAAGLRLLTTDRWAQLQAQQWRRAVTVWAKASLQTRPGRAQVRNEGIRVCLELQLHIPRLSRPTDTSVLNTFTHHAQALGGSAFNSPKDLPETAHAPGQVTVATVRRKQKTNRGEKPNCATLNNTYCFIINLLFLKWRHGVFFQNLNSCRCVWSSSRFASGQIGSHPFLKWMTCALCRPVSRK